MWEVDNVPLSSCRGGTSAVRISDVLVCLDVIYVLNISIERVWSRVEEVEAGEEEVVAVLEVTVSVRSGFEAECKVRR